VCTYDARHSPTSLERGDEMTEKIKLFVTKLLCPKCDEICILQKQNNWIGGTTYRLRCSNCEEHSHWENDKNKLFLQWQKNYKHYRQSEKERKERNKRRYGTEEPDVYPFFGDTTDYGGW